MIERMTEGKKKSLKKKKRRRKQGYVIPRNDTSHKVTDKTATKVDAKNKTKPQNCQP